MNLFDIARSYRLAPEGQDGTPASGGTPPAAGADVKGGEGGTSVLGGAKEDGKGGAADDGAAKKDDPKGSDKPADADPAKADKGAAAGEFKVTIPEGVKVDEAKLATFTKWAQEQKLSPEQASAALALWHGEQKAADQAWEKQDATWSESLKTDKDFGGANFDASVAAAQKAVLKFGGRELADDLERLGIGNLPSLARAFARVGKAIAEDSSRVDAAPKGDGPKPGTKEARLAKMYDASSGASKPK